MKHSNNVPQHFRNVPVSHPHCVVYGTMGPSTWQYQFFRLYN